MSNKKYSKEFKEKLLKEHEEGASFYSLEKEYGLSLGTIKHWHAKMKKYGPDGLVRRNSMLCQYTADFKQKVVNDYLSGGGSYLSISLKYGIHAESTVKKWVTQYNDHEELTDSRKTGGYLMVKDVNPRKTTLEERVEIVEYCIASSNDYASAARKYSCSYGQVYSWVRKYNSDGIEGLKDRRGQNRPEEKLTEEERLRAENRLLRAEMKKKQMEIDLLKKLEEIGRR